MGMNDSTSSMESPVAMSSPPPVTLEGHRIGLREIGLLLLALGFAFLMMDLGNLAIVTGWLAVAVWAYGMIRGPRPSRTLTAVYGAGLFVTYFWWPDQGWWLEAIGLMWIGIGLVLFALCWALADRFRTT
jgi:hypothetical protein